MKKIIHGLLVALATTSAAFGAVSNKTVLAGRGELSANCVMGMTVGSSAKKHDGFGANLSVAGFFRETYNDTDLAKYFGAGLADADRKGTITLGTNDIILQQTGTVTYKPHRQEYGAHVQWSQCLGKLVKGLSFSVDAPVVHVQTRMGATYGDVANIKTYFEGGQATNASTALLTKQKHSSTDNSKTGVANLGVAVAYKLASDADYSVSGKITAGIPTGTKRTGEFAFEPTYGSKNFSLGAGLDALFNLWRADDGQSSLDFTAGVDYSYGFKAKDVRSLGISVKNAAEQDFAHYRLVSNTSGDATAFANVGTKEVDVTPQSSIDGVAGFRYHNGRFTVDVAYNLRWSQEEKVVLLDNWSTADAAYGIAVTNDNDGALAQVDGAIAKTATASTDGLSTVPATSPSAVIHKVGGGVGYSFATATPMRVGVGGDCEFNANNDSANSWGIWAKFGVCF